MSKFDQSQRTNRPAPVSRQGGFKPPAAAGRPRGFVYKPRDPEAVKARIERSGRNFDAPLKDGVDLYKHKTGDNLIRVLPPTWEGADHYGFSVWQHNDIGPDRSTYNCLRKMQNKRCPICEAAEEAKARGAADEAKDLTAKEAVYMYVVDRDEDKPVPRVMRLGWTTDRDMVSVTQNKRTGAVLFIDDPDNGYDMSYNKKGEGRNTRYFGWQVERQPSPVSENPKEQAQILQHVLDNPIPEVLMYYSEDHIDAVFNGVAPERDVDLDATDAGTTVDQDQEQEAPWDEQADENLADNTGEYPDDVADELGEEAPEEPPQRPAQRPRAAAPTTPAPRQQTRPAAAPARGRVQPADDEDEGDEGDDEGMVDGPDPETPSRPHRAAPAPARAPAPVRAAAPPARQTPAAAVRQAPARQAAPPARQAPVRTQRVVPQGGQGRPATNKVGSGRQQYADE